MKRIFFFLIFLMTLCVILQATEEKLHLSIGIYENSPNPSFILNLLTY